LADDITMRLATSGVRIEAPIPNKAAVGIEVPNKVRSIVSLREMIDSAEFSMARSKLTVAIGRDIAGKIILTDLADMPHLLIAGTTNSGKSVCTNSMIQSILYKSSPEDVRLLLVDPKQVEFNVYNGIPHLLVPVVTDARKAAGALGWAVNEMEERYTLFKENHAKDFDSYNQKAVKNYDLASMPKIVIVIDEFADLMMTAASEVEDSVCRLAQKGRAAGIHLVIATQRPSVDVITGVIKANFPSRLALTVASQVDSRTILDSGGADKLLAKGDMLFAPMGHKPTRIQGCFVSEKEVARVVEHLKTEESDYDEGIMQEIEEQAARTVKGKRTVAETEDPDGETDELLNQACEFVIAGSEASVSGIQRRFKVGYARAGRLIDMMEQKGVVGPHEGSKPRKVLISWQQWLEMNMNE
ncbi:MAG: DNA translocase FtsK, partial [Oscillospiraceae bacterium]|nr:DNA translocase FtsK [Oscillospiraceae bacterium]